MSGQESTHIRKASNADGAVPEGRIRRPGGGRRRDPAIDARILEAAQTVYQRDGWAGFTVDAVARAAYVSRDAVNRRYTDLSSLLLAAVIEGNIPQLDTSDGRDIYEVVAEYAYVLFEYFSVGAGTLLFRIHLEAKQFPEVYRTYRREVVEANWTTLTDGLRDLFANAGLDVDELDLPVFIETLTGSVLMHALLNQARESADDGSARVAIRRQVAMAFAALGRGVD